MSFRRGIGYAAIFLAGWTFVSRAELPVEERVTLADGLFQRGMADLALKEYLSLLRDAPDQIDQARVLFQTAECFRIGNQIEVSVGYYRRVAGVYPLTASGARALFRLGERALSVNDYAEAITHFDTLAGVPAVPAELAVAARLLRARALVKSGRTAEAESAFLSILESHPDSEMAADAALEAADLMRKAGGREAEEEALYRRLILLREGEAAGLEARLRLAEMAFRAGRYADAAEACDALFRRAPDSEQSRSAKRLAAWTFLLTDRWAETVKLAEEALREQEKSPDEEWLYLLGNARRQLKNSAGALEAYDRLLKECPQGKHAEAAAYEAALVAFQKGDSVDAIRRASGLKPQGELRTEVDWLLAEAYSAIGKSDEAIQYFRTLMAAPPPAKRSLDAAYRLGQILQSREAWLEAAEAFRIPAGHSEAGDLAARAMHSAAFCLARADRHSEALLEWSHLLHEFPKHPIVEDALFRKALSEISIERADLARETLRSFLEAWPDSAHQADARFWRGVLLEREGRLEDAEREYQAGLKAHPREELQERLHFQQAGVLQKLNRPDEAADLYQGLLTSRLSGEISPALLAWLARRQLDRKRVDEAEIAVQRLLAVSGADAETWHAMGWHLAGRIHAQRGNIDQALVAFDQTSSSGVTGREPVEALVWAGDLYFETGRTDEARKRYESAAERATGVNLLDLRVRALFGLGRVAQTKEAWEEAIRYYQSVAILFDDPVYSPKALRLAAAGLQRVGRNEEAQRTLKELSERYPSAPVE